MTDGVMPSNQERPELATDTTPNKSVEAIRGLEMLNSNDSRIVQELKTLDSVMPAKKCEFKNKRRRK